MSNGNVKISSYTNTIRDLVNNTICKMQAEAIKHETDESRAQFLLYQGALLGLDRLDDYAFTKEDLWTLIPHLKEDVIDGLLAGTIKFADVLSSEVYDYLIEYKRNERLSHYVELNDYYRMLYGLPPYNEKPENFIYIDGKPIHELSDLEIAKLKFSGRLDVIVGENPDLKYLFYLDKKITPIVSRRADQFQVLWTPDKQQYNIYRDCFNEERIVWQNTFGYMTEYLDLSTDFNEILELIILKLRAVIYYYFKTNLDTTRDEFTKEEAKDIWEENGVVLPQKMPDEYRNSVTYMLQYLITMKGTNFVVKYIADKIFAGLKLYKYFIKKTVKSGVTFPIPEGTPPEDVYDVNFILRPYDATNVVDFADPDEEDKILTYDEVVEMDPRWRDSAELKRAVFSEHFSEVESKFISIDNYLDLVKFTDDFSVITRCFIERRRVLEKVQFQYLTTGNAHTFFNLFIYFLNIFTHLQTSIKAVVAPDTLINIGELNGFQRPGDFDLLKWKFLTIFAQHDKIWPFMEKFPNAMDDNMEFINLLVEIDKAVNVTELFYELILEAHNHLEINMLYDLYGKVREVSTTPTSYDMNLGTLDGKTYLKYLEDNDPVLAQLYYNLLQDDTGEKMVLELDNITQSISKMLNSLVADPKTQDITSVSGMFGDANIFLSGISQYLVYILKIFKAYSADFVSEGNIYKISGKNNFQINVDQITASFNGKKYIDWDISQYDQVVIPEDKHIFQDFQQNCDSIIMYTPYGDVKISYDD